MGSEKKVEDRSAKIQGALDKTIQGANAETKAKNSYLVIADKKGNIKKIPAKVL